MNQPPLFKHLITKSKITNSFFFCLGGSLNVPLVNETRRAHKQPPAGFKVEMIGCVLQLFPTKAHVLFKILPKIFPAGRLSGSISHFPSLASEASGSLLLPLSTHTTLHTHGQDDGIGLGKAKSSLGKNRRVLGDLLQVLRDELDVLNGLLKVGQSGVGTQVDREGLLERSHKDLHSSKQYKISLVATEPSKGEQTAEDKVEK